MTIKPEKNSNTVKNPLEKYQHAGIDFCQFVVKSVFLIKQNKKLQNVINDMSAILIHFDML